MLKVKIVILTTLIWLIGCGLYCYWYISSTLSQPIADAYANSAAFQFQMFMLVRFPLLCIALIFVVFVEVIPSCINRVI